MLHTLIDQILYRGHVDLLFKDMSKIEFVNIKMFTNAFDADYFRVIFVDIIFGFKKRLVLNTLSPYRIPKNVSHLSL